MGPEEWEMLELGHDPGSILTESEVDDDEENCCSITLQIELGSLIDANYFACPPPSPKLSQDEPDQGSRVRIPEDDENKFDDKTNAKKLDSAGALDASAAGHAVPYVIEGLCIFRPLVAPEKALLRADSEFSCRAGENSEGDTAGKELICRNNSSSSSCGAGLEGKRLGNSNLLSFLRVWRRRLGALPSFGMAAAVFGLVILGRKIYGGKLSRARKQPQFVRFQIYGDNKRISRLMTEAARLNEALSGAKGAVVGAGLVPVVTAQISFGGYCDGL